ncbi:MAG: hypothetical protein JO360_14155 [Acidobacteria bacterium]|nr:hypothetical protein [Acidobacteriota bacterium]
MESALVESSRAAIIKTGISPKYFAEHFRLERVIDAPGDRRVIWKFSVGEYVATLNDAVGFYTDEKGRRINTHAIGNTLSASHDIKNTIPRKRAEQLMRVCIGPYTPGGIIYQAFGTELKASLLFMASSIPAARTEREKEAREKSERKRERERKERARSNPSQADMMEEEDEGEDAPLIYTGIIDLETGACTKGIAQADHPKPVK